ncbi:hypothetical protein BHE74_00024188 [Ensete ventricosum]|nr:hypothetical protein BHE74_00024188 [Ensete ventricosum]RZS02446.1 hypothetical protein BHM03_00032499 [Ensete ventricosum]
MEQAMGNLINYSPTFFFVWIRHVPLQNQIINNRRLPWLSKNVIGLGCLLIIIVIAAQLIQLGTFCLVSLFDHLKILVSACGIY